MIEIDVEEIKGMRRKIKMELANNLVVFHHWLKFTNILAETNKKSILKRVEKFNQKCGAK